MTCVVFGNGPNAVGARHRLGMANALRKPTQQELIAFFEEFSQLNQGRFILDSFFHLPHSSIRIKIEGWRRGREARSQFVAIVAAGFFGLTVPRHVLNTLGFAMADCTDDSGC
jgi:hypothetical protein